MGAGASLWVPRGGGAFPTFWTGRLIFKWPLGLGYACPWGPFPTSRDRRLHFQMGAVARAGVPRGAARFSDGRRGFAMGAQGGVSNVWDRPLDFQMGAGAAVWVPRGAVSNFGDQRLYFQRPCKPLGWTTDSSFTMATGDGRGDQFEQETAHRHGDSNCFFFRFQAFPTALNCTGRSKKMGTTSVCFEGLLFTKGHRCANTRCCQDAQKHNGHRKRRPASCMWAGPASCTWRLCGLRACPGPAAAWQCLCRGGYRIGFPMGIGGYRGVSGCEGPRDAHSCACGLGK